MQLLLNISKYIILAILSFSFLVVWYSKNNIDTQFSIIYPDFYAINTLTTINPNLSTAIDFIKRELVYPTKPGTPAPSKINHSIPGKKISFIWQSISADLNMNHYENLPAVKAEIRKLLAEKNQLKSILKAAGPYIYYIYEETQAHHLPAEIALIPIIESEFNPNDHSNKGATGLWQLMPRTAHELGVHIRAGYDGRRNVIASTKAALAYFKDLGVLFKKNWYLAIAAYNCGQVKVASAMRHANSRNIWVLSLPKQTKYYVPKLLAVAAILKNPNEYGIVLPPITNEPYFTQLKINHAVTLANIAKSSGVSLDELKVLNPDYNKIAPSKNSILLVPVDEENKIKSLVL